jgi:DNA repair protein RecO (recombination protein O)
MDWTDDAIVLSLRAHGETSAILEALTREHGRHLGLVRGGASSKRRAVLQPGNTVRVQWRARLSEHLGTFTCEPVRLRAGDMFETRAALIGLNAFTAVASAVLPEREAHTPAFEDGEYVLEIMAGHGIEEWGRAFVRWELALLEELGFGLDLSTCAGTGTTENLIYVSPRSGRAVSAEAGKEYRDKLLPLPAFLFEETRTPVSPADLADALKLTAYFLNHWVLEPHGKTIPEPRRRLADLASSRNASESA